MLATELHALLESKNTEWTFAVEGEGRNFQIEAVSGDFESMTRVKRQQAVLRIIAGEIADGILHAITVTALTPEEKSKCQGLGI